MQIETSVLMQIHKFPTMQRINFSNDAWHNLYLFKNIRSILWKKEKNAQVNPSMINTLASGTNCRWSKQSAKTLCIHVGSHLLLLHAYNTCILKWVEKRPREREIEYLERGFIPSSLLASVALFILLCHSRATSPSSSYSFNNFGGRTRSFNTYI